MTVETTLIKKKYEGNDVAREFSIPFAVQEGQQIFLVYTDRGGNAAAVSSNYEINKNAAGDFMSVTYPVIGDPIPTGTTLLLYRYTPRTQVADITNAGAYHPEVVEHQGLDRIVMMIQELQETLDRAVKVDINSDMTAEELLAILLDAVYWAKLAEEAAKRAEMAADLAELASYVKNIRRSWTAAEDIEFGGTLFLPGPYYPGRDMLLLMHEGTVCDPVDSRSTSAPQYEEIGDPAMDVPSYEVRVLFPVKAGEELSMWVIASNAYRVSEEVKGFRDEAMDAADRSGAEADRAEEARDAAQAAHGAAESAKDAAAASAADAETAKDEAVAAKEAAEEAASGATGVIPIERGGTSATTADAARSNLQALATRAIQANTGDLNNGAGIFWTTGSVYFCTAGVQNRPNNENGILYVLGIGTSVTAASIQLYYSTIRNTAYIRRWTGTEPSAWTDLSQFSGVLPILNGGTGSPNARGAAANIMGANSVISVASDLNAYMESGRFHVLTGAVNSPVGVMGAVAGELDVIWYSSSVITQLFYGAGAGLGKVAIRTYNGTSWAAWVEVRGAPVPQTSTGIGQWFGLPWEGNGQIVLPGGGAWAWLIVDLDSGVMKTRSGVSAGGTVIYTSANPGLSTEAGFAWRIA